MSILSHSNIPSVNFHLWEPCNMRCKFCYATFQDVKNTVLPKGHLPKEQAFEVIRRLAEYGFQKITFAGGEPTLCPWLSELIKFAKNKGLTTMIVTNGTQLSTEFLKENNHFLDWIAVSIDSLEDETNLETGRAVCGKKILTKKDYISIIDRIKTCGDYRLKINTVVNKTNFKEDMTDFITQVNPERWKVLQVLSVEGQNSLHFDDFSISGDDFKYFLDTHKKCKTLVPENNEIIKGSYVMIDPAGRFFHNNEEHYVYSTAINEAGVAKAFSEMSYSEDKFIERGGVYEW